MKKCENCYKQFNWWKIIRTVWLEKYTDPMVCNNCSFICYVNFSTKLIAILSASLPIFVDAFIYKMKYFIFIQITWMVMMMIITPFYARFHVKQNNS